MKRSKAILVPLILICITCTAGCYAKTEKQDLQKENAQESLQQMPEEDLQETVVALSSSNAQLWLLAGGELAAASDDAMDLPGITEGTVSVGDMDYANLEAIVSLDPDLVILFETDPKQKAMGEKLESLGFEVMYTNIDGFDDYAQVMKMFTDRTGRGDLYVRYVTQIRERIDRILMEHDGGISGTYLLFHVSSTKSKVEQNDYFAAEILNDLGLVNLAGEISGLDEMSLETVLKMDPDWIFMVPRGDEEKAKETFGVQFESQPAWQTLSAYQNGRIRLLPKELFGLKPNDKWADAYEYAAGILTE